MAIVLRWSAFFGCCMGVVYCWAWDAIERIVEGPLYTSDADLSYQIGICLASGFVWALIFMISLAAMWRVLKPSSPPRVVLGCVSLIALLVQVAAFAGYDLLVTRLDVFPRIYGAVVHCDCPRVTCRIYYHVPISDGENLTLHRSKAFAVPVPERSAGVGANAPGLLYRLPLQSKRLIRIGKELDRRLTKIARRA